MTDPTRPVPAAGGPPPGPGGPPGPPPGGPGEPPGEPPGPDRRVVAVASLVGVIILLLVVLLLVRLGDDDSTASTSSTTSSTTTSETTDTSTSSTTSSTTTTTTTTTTTAPTTTTTAPPTTTTTTTAPPVTIAPQRCTGKSDPEKPETPATVFYDAWSVGDRTCAEKVANDDAVDTLFAFDGTDNRWSFQGCEDGEDPGPSSRCYYSYEGGVAYFDLRYGAIDGWEVYAVDFIAD